MTLNRQCGWTKACMLGILCLAVLFALAGCGGQRVKQPSSTPVASIAVPSPHGSPTKETKTPAGSRGNGDAPVSAGSRVVVTYFYYWYDLPRGPHSAELTHKPADPNTSYRNVDWFKKQLVDMAEAGIDGALAVYWGPAEPSSDVGLVNMVGAVNELRAAGREPPRIALFLDTGVIGRWPLSQRNFLQQENQDRVYALIHDFFDIVPDNQRLLIAGRPVVWLWANYFDIKFDQSFFDYVSSRFNADFGIRPYIVAESSWRLAKKPDLRKDEPIRLDAYYEWGAGLFGFRPVGGGVAQVGPGYDERLLKGSDRTGRYADREGGHFYERNLMQAIASGEPILAIETWNEFHEATDIAESKEYGRQYIEITRQYVERFKKQAPRQQ